MYQKLFAIIFASLLLGGCSLNLPSEKAATDTKSSQPELLGTPSPADAQDKSEPLSQDTEIDSLQKDIDSTIIIEEDFSDL